MIKMIRSKLSLRIPVTLMVIVVMAGIIIFVQRAVRAQPFLTSYFIIWLVVSVILIGISIWSWMRGQKK